MPFFTSKVIAAAALSVNVDRKGMIPLVTKAMNDLFHEPKDAFWTGHPMDLLFNGIEMDCSSDDFNTRAVCSVFETGEQRQIEQIDDTTFKFSILGAFNGTEDSLFKVFRGSKNYADLGRVISVDDEDEMDIWDDEVGECNAIKGTDGLIFSPLRKREDPVVAYEKMTCRSFFVPFERKTKYRGIPVDEFTYDLGDVQNEPDNLCFCREEDQCPVKGTMDLFPCVGAPITVSMPHFYNADPSLAAKIADGVMRPNKKAHQIFLKIEMVSILRQRRTNRK